MYDLKIQLYPRRTENTNGQYIELAQGDDQHYYWYVYSLSGEYQTRHHGSLKNIEQHYHHQTPEHDPNIWHMASPIELNIRNNYGTKTIFCIGYLTILSSQYHKNQSSITIQPENNGENPPNYDITTIYNMSAQDTAKYILAYIRVNDVQDRIFRVFPKEHQYRTPILHHYAPQISPSIPCTTSQIVNVQNNTPFTSSYKNFHQDGPNIQYQYIRIGTWNQHSMKNPNDPCIDPNDPMDIIMPIIQQHIHASYLQRPEIKALSQHEQIRIHRIFRDHGHDIANQVYRDAIQHRATYFQSTLFTHPPTTP